MADNKKSFILYTDLIHTVRHLTDEQAGKLFKHILSYCNDESPESDDVILNLAFEPIKLQLKRDLRKFEEVKKGRSNSGVLGNLKRWNKDLYQKVISDEMGLEEAQTIAKHRKATKSIANVAVNDTVTVNDTNTIVLDTKKIDSYISELKNQHQFLEGLYMTYKFRNRTIGKIALRFKEHLKMYPKNHKDFMDFRNHFKSWIDLSVKHQKLGEFLKHQKGEL